jgi:hypothetical protein
MRLRTLGIHATLALAAIFALALTASAQRDKDEEPTSVLSFVVLKGDNGKPVRSAAVIMHPVSHGKQGKGGLELKTDAEGKASFDGIPYGKLRVQVLAPGFQTYGDDFVVEQPTMNITVKLQRPQGQYSIYEDHAPSGSNPPPKQDTPNGNGGNKDAPPPDAKDAKPN